MGNKQIWNGRQVPTEGMEVLIHLASLNKWVKQTVSGFHILPAICGTNAEFRIFINVYRMEGRQKIRNCRLLSDIRPIDWQEGDPYNPAQKDAK